MEREDLVPEILVLLAELGEALVRRELLPLSPPADLLVLAAADRQRVLLLRKRLQSSSAQVRAKRAGTNGARDAAATAEKLLHAELGQRAVLALGLGLASARILVVELLVVLVAAVEFEPVVVLAEARAAAPAADALVAVQVVVRMVVEVAGAVRRRLGKSGHSSG